MNRKTDKLPTPQPQPPQPPAEPAGRWTRWAQAIAARYGHSPRRRGGLAMTLVQPAVPIHLHSRRWVHAAWTLAPRIHLAISPVLQAMAAPRPPAAQPGWLGRRTHVVSLAGTAGARGSGLTAGLTTGWGESARASADLSRPDIDHRRPEPGGAAGRTLLPGGRPSMVDRAVRPAARLWDRPPPPGIAASATAITTATSAAQVAPRPDAPGAAWPAPLARAFARVHEVDVLRAIARADDAGHMRAIARVHEVDVLRAIARADDAGHMRAIAVSHRVQGSTFARQSEEILRRIFDERLRIETPLPPRPLIARPVAEARHAKSIMPAEAITEGSPHGPDVGAPAMARAVVPPAVDIDRVTEAVVRQLDRRLVAYRERMGKAY